MASLGFERRGLRPATHAHWSVVGGVVAGKQTYDLLCDVSGGDLRKAITTMQSASHLYGDTVTTDAVIEISGV